jgi:GDPmannose 4,6-dehydratase
MFGKVVKTPQNEQTPFYPRSSYGISKVAGFDLTRNYREAYNLFACSGILFNHESPRRGFEFVTRKISFAVAKIKLGLQKNLYLGNLNAKRDWGHAHDYIKAMWLMLQKKSPTDYVVGTGKTYSVKEFVKIAFGHVGLNYKDYVKKDKRLFRPAEVDLLKADFSKAKKELKWKPETSFKELVINMVESDLNFVKNHYKNE